MGPKSNRKILLRSDSISPSSEVMEVSSGLIAIAIVNSCRVNGRTAQTTHRMIVVAYSRSSGLILLKISVYKPGRVVGNDFSFSRIIRGLVVVDF
jgi:hypothetical protein